MKRSKDTDSKYIQKFSLSEDLLKADQQYEGSTALLGKTALTFPSYNDAMRTNMNTTHLNQLLNLVNPDFPLVFTNAENLVGKYSDGYKKVKHKSRVFRKVVKYEELVEHPNIYTLFIFDDKEKKFKVIERKPMEDLTENFGYEYDNSVIDRLEEDDVIKKDTILYKSKSYDDNMDYCFGKNVMTMYTCSSKTFEDSAVISESLSKSFISIESEKIYIGLNDNDFLLNLYGGHGNVTDSDNPDEYYKPLPDIGMKVDGNLIATRRLFKNQILYDFKQDSLNEIHDGDNVYSVDNDTEIIDYTFFENGEERKDNMFTHQLNKYLKAQDRYFEEIKETCEEIIASGYDYSRDIDHLYKRAIEMTEKEKKWKEGDSAFSNMVIEVTIRKYCPLNVGQKIAGRYGNKSVISEIIPDDEMPFTDDGRRVDLLLNLCAIVNRTTAFPMYELTLSSMAYKIRNRMRTMKTLKEKEAILFKFLLIFNRKQYQVFWRAYLDLSEADKEEFMRSVIEEGIYLHQPPLWEEEKIFYRIQKLRKEFPWAVDDSYNIRLKNGEVVKALNDSDIGTMYILKLKQTDRRGFSGRNTGAIDIKGLPTRSYKSRAHLERNSETPIRFGEYETLNFTIGLGTEDIAAFHALYRTSVKGRKDLVKLMFKNTEENGYIDTIDNSYTNRVNEIFRVILKSLSIDIDFVDKDNIIYPTKIFEYSMHKYKNKTILCSDYQLKLLKITEELKEAYMREKGVARSDELNNYIEREVKEMGLLIRNNTTVRETLGNLMNLI